MQIVIEIEIDDDDYKLIKDGGNIPSNLRDLITSSLFYRIRNGKLLPKGHWIDTGSGQECSECGEIQHGYDNFRYFCAYCGAKMTESEE